METEFKVGDKAVYPTRGVGEVVSIEEKTIAGNRQHFYVLRLLDTNHKVMVPVNNASRVGLRAPISEREIRKIFAVLKKRSVPKDNQAWNRRYRGFMEKLQTGSLYDAAEVMRDLSWLKTEKSLSHSEKLMLERATTLVVKEIAVARSHDETKVQEKIEKIFVVPES